MYKRSPEVMIYSVLYVCSLIHNTQDCNLSIVTVIADIVLVPSTVIAILLVYIKPLYNV